MPALKKQSKLIHRTLNVQPADIELCIGALYSMALERVERELGITEPQQTEEYKLADKLAHRGSRPVARHPTKPRNSIYD
jgi:hypothetical protein